MKNHENNTNNYTAKEFDNLEETNNFLETCRPSKMNQEEIDNLNSPITRNEIEYVILKKFLINKSLGSDGFTGKFYQTHKEDTFQKIEERTLPKTFYESTITETKDYYQKRNYRPISLMNIDAKNLYKF